MQQGFLNTVKHCDKCVKKLPPAREPLITTELPLYPWQQVATDLFVLKGFHYLLIVDYFSWYPLLIKLGNNTTSTAVITALKSIFALLGIPETVVSDNGPQYASLIQLQPYNKQSLLSTEQWTGGERGENSKAADNKLKWRTHGITKLQIYAITMV